MSDYYVQCQPCGWIGLWSQTGKTPSPAPFARDGRAICPQCRSKGDFIAGTPLLKLAAANAALRERIKELEAWQPILAEIDRRAGKEHALEDNCDFTVTVDIEDYKRVEAARQALTPAKEGV